LKSLFHFPSKKQFLFFSTSIFLPGILFFIWEAFFAFKVGAFNFISSPADFQHYSEISVALSESGQENIFGMKNLLMDDFLGNTPYHYFELWFNNGASNLFNSINILTLMVVTYPVFYWISYIGICAIWESYNKVNALQKTISILFVGMGGVYFIIYKQIPYLGAGQLLCSIPIDTYFRKFITYYPFVITSWLFFRYQKINLAIISILCLPIISIGSFPGIIVSIILFALFEHKVRKELKCNRILSYAFIFTLFIVSFYLVMPRPTVMINNLVAIFSFKHWMQLSTYKTIFNIYVLTTSQVIFYYSPFFILLYFFTKDKITLIKKIPSSLVFLIFLYISSLSTWAFLHATGNARQFFSNGVSVILIIWLIAYLIRLVVETKFNKVLVLSICVLLSFNIYRSFENNYSTKSSFQSDAYLNTISLKINNLEGDDIFGAIIFPTSEIETITQRRDKAFHIYPLAHYTNYFKKRVDVQNLSVYDAPPLKDKLKEKRFKHLIEITPFFRFVEKQKLIKEFDSLEMSQLSFIKKFKLKFIILRKGAGYPAYLKNLIKEVITDEKSGDLFIMLKNN
jgi:hypothetical protein